ncbi:MAG: endopeptidase IV [Gammaproteobacteria bacterium]|nr:endopeptidase IV [Gammaproteobacteria bacterium]
MKSVYHRSLLQVLCASVLLLGGTALGFAAKRDAEIRSPLGCKDVGYGFDLSVLEVLPDSAGDSQSLYFIYNKAKKPINLYQMRQSESSQSVYLNHTIPAGRWAVLSSSERMKYICTIHDGKSTHGRVIDCETGLKVCEYARVKYGMNNRGNYWLAHGNTRGGAVRQVIYYGIIPR